MAMAYLIIPVNTTGLPGLPGLTGLCGLDSLGIRNGLVSNAAGNNGGNVVAGHDLGFSRNSGLVSNAAFPGFVATDARRSRGLTPAKSSTPSMRSSRDLASKAAPFMGTNIDTCGKKTSNPVGGLPVLQPSRVDSLPTVTTLPQLLLAGRGLPLVVTQEGMPPILLTPPVTGVTTLDGQLRTTGQHAARSLQTAAATQLSAPANEPLSGWTPQKQQLPGSSEWAFPMMPPALDDLPAAAHAEVDDGLPDDLQDLFMDSPSVSSLPGDDANSILEDLISGSVREHPQLFGDSSPPGDDGDLMAACSPEQFSPQSVDLMPSPGFGADFSPNPQQVPVESWSPGLSPQSTDMCLSPRQYPGGEPVAVADWSPLRESPPSRRRGARPRPYDKPEKGGTRKPPLSDEERRQRKKEQNKNAATRYRQKKKEEHELVSGDQDMLESRNKQLRSKVAGLTKELNYLRGLMREVLRHRSADK